MAAGQHNLSRRALLGAAAALPLLGAGDVAPVPAAPLRAVGTRRRGIPDQVRDDEEWRRADEGGRRADGEWREAMDAYLVAQTELEEAEDWPAPRHGSGQAPRQGSGQAEEDFEAEQDERRHALCAALRRLLRTPAPDLRALALKLDLAVEHELTALAGGSACLAAMRADARRLAPGYPDL